MGFAEVAEEACRTGPRWSKNFGFISKLTVLLSLFTTYYMTCSCYSVIIAENLQQVAQHYVTDVPNLRACIAILLIPLILLSYVPNLKYLAPVSMVANLFMAVGLGITLYYLVTDIPDISTRDMAASITTLPIFVSITIFAIEAIGVVSYWNLLWRLNTNNMFVCFLGNAIRKSHGVAASFCRHLWRFESRHERRDARIHSHRFYGLFKIR